LNYYDREAAAAAIAKQPANEQPATVSRRADQPQQPRSLVELKQAARRFAAHCAAYKGADTGKAVLQIISTAIPFIATLSVMFYMVERSYALTLLLSLPAAGLLIRFFIIQHDCGHGSFFPSRLANDTLGRTLSILTVAPYGLWRRSHAQHHASSGNLERRGIGDIDTLTVNEYLSLNHMQRLKYRLYRNPAFLLLFGVPFYFLVLHRLPWGHPYRPRETWRSVTGTNLGMLGFYGLLTLLLGWKSMLLVALPIVIIASIIGGWLFFVQHQFEDTFWEESKDWNFQVAAIYGSSYYVLPKILQWFTGNIGLHHIHHLCSMIPNYRLQDCIDANPELQNINRLTLWQSFKCVHLKLWDEKNRRLIGFAELGRIRRAVA